MKNNNKQSTRYFSEQHENSVCKALNATRQANSGAGKFAKGDVVQKAASLLAECKCSMTEKQSVSISKEWINKNQEEARSMRLSNTCVCFNFSPDGDNYYVINERLMKFLIEKLIEENS